MVVKWWMRIQGGGRRVLRQKWRPKSEMGALNRQNYRVERIAYERIPFFLN